MNTAKSRSRKETISLDQLKTGKDFCIAVTRVSRNSAFHLRGIESA